MQIKSFAIMAVFGISLFVFGYTINAVSSTSKQLAENYKTNTTSVLQLAHLDALSNIG
jgi:hypothetical protein